MESDINSIQDKIITEFSKIEDWFEIYDHLISRAKSFENVDETIKNDSNSIGGCQSAVWIKAEKKHDTIHFEADSDSLIIKGILSLLLEVVNDQNPTDIAHADFYFLDQIGLKSHLSPSRANGLHSIVNEIKTKAKAYALNDTN